MAVRRSGTDLPRRGMRGWYGLGRTEPGERNRGLMIALCAEIARNHAIDLARKAECRKRDLMARCERDEYCPPQFGTKQRDPVDAGRQLEVLAQLFREGRMPDGGVEI